MINTPSLAATLLLVTVTSTFALTEADITPAVLVGKTLTFAIINGGSPYSTTGTWSGTFAASGNGFDVANISGDTVPISTTYTAAINGMSTDVALAKFIEGQAPATLSLFILNGVPKYEVFISGVFGVSLNGTFTIGTTAPVVPPVVPVVPPVTPPATPEIAIQQPAGSYLTDGGAKKSFGTLKIGKTGKTRVFTITNTGTADLTGLSIKKDGVRKSDFIVGALGATFLAPGASTTFKVSFKPSAKGTRKAAIHILSNDETEASFDIQLAGEGAIR
ncbi:MAG: hypothetical protein RLZZ214_3144 [Verrucomicrobiota bacterium]